MSPRAAEPLRVFHEVITGGYASFLWRMQNTEEVVGFSERELCMAEGEHRGESRRFGWVERSDLLVAFEHGPEVVEVNKDFFAMLGFVHENEPLHDVAFDGLGKVVDGVGAIG